MILRYEISKYRNIREIAIGFQTAWIVLNQRHDFSDGKSKQVPSESFSYNKEGFYGAET